jgi:hypothetical protein
MSRFVLVDKAASVCSSAIDRLSSGLGERRSVEVSEVTIRGPAGA